MNITVAGAGYVGLANAVLLAKNNPVTIVDIDAGKVSKINNAVSPIDDKEIMEHLSSGDLDLKATTDESKAYSEAELVFVATPTNHLDSLGGFDTSSVESVIHRVRELNQTAPIVIKSTVPTGFTRRLASENGYNNLFFSPEFLREGKALYDCLHPSRIIVGTVEESDEALRKAEMLVALLLSGAEAESAPTLIMGSTEAEAVKLFSNAYLAMRVGFINELDSFAELYDLDTKSIITGMGMDERIGLHYNNPSFGYGGYCLPKDSKELRAEYKHIPHEIISAIVESNITRKKHIVSRIMELKPKTVGIYRLTMKSGSDNFRESSVMDIIRELLKQHVEVIIYEPLLDENDTSQLLNFFGEESTKGITTLTSLEEFAKKSDVIVANRLTSELTPYIDKVYSRDIFGEN